MDLAAQEESTPSSESSSAESEFSESSSSRTHTIPDTVLETEGGFSTKAAPCFGSEVLRMRAWAKERARRDRKVFARRQMVVSRCKDDTALHEARSAPQQTAQMQHLLLYRAGHFPAGPLPPNVRRRRDRQRSQKPACRFI